MIGIGLIIPIIPSLLKDITGETTAHVAVIGGYLMTAYAGVQFLFAPVLGQLSDRFGRKPVLLFSLFGLGLDYVIHAFAPTLAWLFLGRIIGGMFGASHTVAFAYIADISTKENKAKNFGLIGAAFGLGFVIGPGIGGVLGEAFGPRSPFILAAIFSLLNLLFGLFFVKESLPKEKRRKIDYSKMIPFVAFAKLSRYKAVLGFILAFAMVQFAGQVMPSTWTYFTEATFGWDESDNGWSLMLVGLLVSLVQAVLTGRLVKKYGNKKVIILGFMGWIIGLISIAFANSTLILLLALFPYIIGGIAGPTIQGVVSNHVDDSEQGNLQGVLASFGSLAAVIMPLIFTRLFEFGAKGNSAYYFPGAPYFLGGLLVIGGLFIVLKALANKTPKDEEMLNVNETIIDDGLIQG